jgi:hypothetical protein
MLESVQPEVSEFLRLRMGKDRHHPALVVEFVGNQHLAISFLGFQRPPQVDPFLRIG